MSPRVLHLNDCAFVGANMIAAAGRAGHRWRMLGRPWPKLRPGEKMPSPAAQLSAYSRRWCAQALSQVVHVHYGRTSQLVYYPLMPSRPYVLHLHGTDIRSLWTQPRHHEGIQIAIDRASHVFYTTRDLELNATSARADAEYMPVFVDPSSLPRWQPGVEGRRIVFASRWDPVKGAGEMIALARSLRAALPGDVELVGLDWGESASEAAAAGVRLVSTMPHEEYLAFLANSDLAIGQTNTVLGVSEIEAMGIGLPLAGLGDHLPGPDGGRVPILDGNLEEVVEQVLAAMTDPVEASRRLGAKPWVASQHTADAYVPRLIEVYRAAIRDHEPLPRRSLQDFASIGRTGIRMVTGR